MKKKKETGCGADLEVAGSAIPAGPEEAGEGSVLCPGLRHVRWFGAEVEPRPRTVRPAPRELGGVAAWLGPQWSWRQCGEAWWRPQAAASRREHSWEQLSGRRPFHPPRPRAPFNASPVSSAAGARHTSWPRARSLEPRPSLCRHTAGQSGAQSGGGDSGNVWGVLSLPAFQGKSGLVDPRCVFSRLPQISTWAFGTGFASLILDSMSLSHYLLLKWSHYILLSLI